MTSPRELTDSELVQLAKMSEEAVAFGESSAFFKLHYSGEVGAFYFENPEN